jgi:hypothetical protein
LKYFLFFFLLILVQVIIFLNFIGLIPIEDVEPEVFQELLRFIYTGRVSLDKMETMAAGLLFAADKYLLDRLKKECENYLLNHMSPENCVVLLLHGNRLNLAEHLKEAAKFFLRFPLEVMATEGWKKTKQENPVEKYFFSGSKIWFPS